MSFLTNMISQMQATNLRFQGQQSLMKTNQSMMDLANSVGPNMSQGDVFQLQAHEKELMFAGIKAQTQLLFANAWLEQAVKQREQDKKLGKRLRAAGALFY